MEERNDIGNDIFIRNLCVCVITSLNIESLVKLFVS